MFSRKQTKTITQIGPFSLLAIAFLLVITACTPSANAGGGIPAAVTTQSDQNGITVIGTGEAIGQPDEAHVTVGVETFAKAVNDATSENEATIQTILAALKEQGIAPEDIQTSNYSLWAEQLYGDNGPEGIAGYRISNQVNVTIRDIEKVGDILTATINAGANSIYGVTFSVADPAVLEAEAREAAIIDARDRAESLAQLSGVELGDIQVITETFTQMPFPMMGFGGGGGERAVADTSISPGQLSYQVQVQVTFAMK